MREESRVRTLLGFKQYYQWLCQAHPSQDYDVMGEYFVCFCGGLKLCCHLYVENVHSQYVFMIHVEAYHRVIMSLNGIKGQWVPRQQPFETSAFILLSFTHLKSSNVIMLTSHVYGVMLDRALKATFGVFPDAVSFFQNTNYSQKENKTCCLHHKTDF